MNIITLASLATIALVAASPARAQMLVEPGPAAREVAATVPVPATPLTAAATDTSLPGASFKRLFSDTAKDFKELGTGDSARWLAIGTAAALITHPKDAAATRMLARPELKQTFGQGQLLGSAPFQMGGAMAAFTIGKMTGNARAVQVGGELFRAQTVAQLTTYGIKYAVRRTRPDGTSFSFPSGHTAVTFASATVMQRNFGWKVGIPAYGVAAYVAGSRLQKERHHLSDVAFGAALGILAGRSVTVGRGSARMAMTPAAVAGGAGVNFTLVGNK
jgi:hypothetical protein